MEDVHVRRGGQHPGYGSHLHGTVGVPQVPREYGVVVHGTQTGPKSQQEDFEDDFEGGTSSHIPSTGGDKTKNHAINHATPSSTTTSSNVVPATFASAPSTTMKAGLAISTANSSSSITTTAAPQPPPAQNYSYPPPPSHIYTQQPPPPTHASTSSNNAEQPNTYRFIMFDKPISRRKSCRLYNLKLRQQPKHSRMCGFGEK
ncbi:hypothetical protein HK102_007872, partial [Quaeritorhiza haematococci]